MTLNFGYEARRSCRTLAFLGALKLQACTGEMGSTIAVACKDHEEAALRMMWLKKEAPWYDWALPPQICTRPTHVYEDGFLVDIVCEQPEPDTLIGTLARRPMTAEEGSTGHE